jgi:hypothetical protein
MIEKRRFIRVRPSGNVSRLAKIVVDVKSPIIDCSVIDYAAGGACLAVAPGITLPKTFELLHAGTKRRCRVVWTNGLRLGVSF